MSTDSKTLITNRKISGSMVGVIKNQFQETYLSVKANHVGNCLLCYKVKIGNDEQVSLLQGQVGAGDIVQW